MFIFLDTETTGTEKDDRLCQIAYKTDDGSIIRNELFKPEEKEISVEAMCVHHITNEMVAQKPFFKGSPIKNELIELFSDTNNYLVAHNAQFDVGMLQREGVFPNNIICTLKLARFLDKDGALDKYNLQYLRYKLKLNIQATPHDALGDIIVLEAVFERIHRALLKRNNEDKYKTLQEMIEISSKPSLLPKMAFGKYRGIHFKEIPIDYLEWLFGKNDLDEDLKYTIEHYLALQ